MLLTSSPMKTTFLIAAICALLGLCSEVRSQGTAATTVAQGSGTLTAPGNGNHNYVVSPIDTSQFPNGGSLTINIVVGSGQSSASFDLYAQGAQLASQGYARSLAHAYDLAPGTRKSIVYSFSKGQVFQFCAEGNWFSPKGSTNTYSFVASVG